MCTFPFFHPLTCLSRHHKHCFRSQILSHLSPSPCLPWFSCLSVSEIRLILLFSLFSCFFFSMFTLTDHWLLFSFHCSCHSPSPLFQDMEDIQQASCTDRLSRGLLENTAQEQKCKQVELSFVEFHSFPCHNTLTLNIPLSSMVCCGVFCGPNFPKAPYCACSPLLTISQDLQNASHPFSVLGILQADGVLLWIYVTLFLAPSIHKASKFTLTHSFQTAFCWWPSLTNMTSHSTSKLHKTLSILIIYRLTQYKHPTACPTGSIFLL